MVLCSLKVVPPDLTIDPDGTVASEPHSGRSCRFFSLARKSKRRVTSDMSGNWLRRSHRLHLVRVFRFRKDVNEKINLFLRNVGKLHPSEDRLLEKLIKDLEDKKWKSLDEEARKGGEALHLSELTTVDVRKELELTESPSASQLPLEKFLYRSVEDVASPTRAQRPSVVGIQTARRPITDEEKREMLQHLETKRLLIQGRVNELCTQQPDWFETLDTQTQLRQEQVRLQW